ncbi:MAG: lipoprotein signal peptidase [Lewinella sp.]|nr:lipoprotein signal peptidase [Lewinella sp.]
MIDRKNTWLVVGIVMAVLVIDQAVKIWVKTHLNYGATIPMLGSERAFIHFVENEGMAFGKKLDIPYGKLVLSLFRIVAVGFLIYFLRDLLRKADVSRGVLFSFALILAGATGNIIDSAFYGLIFSTSYHHGDPAQLFPPEGGYGTFLHGRVVDMFYFPLFEGTYPDWLPWLGGKPFLFFRPVFNIADVAITWGVLQVLIFHRHFFSKPVPEEAPLSTDADVATEEE